MKHPFRTSRVSALVVSVFLNASATGRAQSEVPISSAHFRHVASSSRFLSAQSAPKDTTSAPVPQLPPNLVAPAKFEGRNASGTFGSVERLAPEFDAVIAPGATLELLAEGFRWSEGPTWLWREKAVVFSDVPENKVYKWSRKHGIQVFLDPSGYTGTGLQFNEPGSNGLTVGPDGRLVLCQHGDRRISRLTDHGFEALAKYYQLKKFNSPNDLVFDRSGNLYFTDPPYGLSGLNESPLKEIPFNGVYLCRPNGEVVLLTKEMTFPNGLALSPDEKTLYVGQSDAKNPILRAFPVKDDGTLGESRLFFDVKPYLGRGPGMPDGMKVDRFGNVFTTGPDGILVISPASKLLGIIHTGVATGNCCWGDDGSTLYITANHQLGRIRTRTRGSAWR
jgi:gluconolactonase